MFVFLLADQSGLEEILDFLGNVSTAGEGEIHLTHILDSPQRAVVLDDGGSVFGRESGRHHYGEYSGVLRINTRIAKLVSGTREILSQSFNLEIR